MSAFKIVAEVKGLSTKRAQVELAKADTECLVSFLTALRSGFLTEGCPEALLQALGISSAQFIAKLNSNQSEEEQPDEAEDDEGEASNDHEEEDDEGDDDEDHEDDDEEPEEEDDDDDDDDDDSSSSPVVIKKPASKACAVQPRSAVCRFEVPPVECLVYFLYVVGGCHRQRRVEFMGYVFGIFRRHCVNALWVLLMFCGCFVDVLLTLCGCVADVTLYGKTFEMPHAGHQQGRH